MLMACSWFTDSIDRGVLRLPCLNGLVLLLSASAVSGPGLQNPSLHFKEDEG